MAEIGGISNLSSIVRPISRGVEKAATPAKSSFEEAFTDTLKSVNTEELKAERAMTEFAVGKNTNLHETLLAIESSSVQLRLMVKARNKVIEAYQEIMRMPI